MTLLRRTGWILGSVVAVFMLLGVVALSYAYSQIPKLGGRGVAPVLAAPPQLHNPLPAYTGEHPRLSGRPDDDFEFPITLGKQGPVTPLFAGDLQYPFLCGDDQSRYTDSGEREQPLVDNQQGLGIPIYALNDDAVKTESIVGYSKDCLRVTRAGYYYNRLDSTYFFPLEQADNDIARITLDGVERDFIVRFETGTINRFIYAIAVLASAEDNLAVPSGKLWNGKLVYQLRGGVGIGRRQGNLKPKDVLKRRREQLSQGYAVVYSTANQTSNHYNIWLAEDTALRVKRQFVGLYGKPRYTLGIGGSGGAIQQYLFGQNNPGLIDGAVALYSYPDMVSQTIYVMDCEPLEHYFERLASDTSNWVDWSRRAQIEGLSSTASGHNYYQWATAAADFLNGRPSRVLNGGTECIRGWRGLTQLIHNPTFIHFPDSFSASVLKQSHWTHWEDVKTVYGVGENGYANSTWDNRGVQYGLETLKSGGITAEEFLHLNARIGGWKPPAEMLPERLWFLAKDWFSADFSAWSEQNHYSSAVDGVARRSEGNESAITGAFNAGLVFSGYIDIPIIDLRHYLDDELDMHHSFASFSSRSRMQKAMGKFDNQVVWVTHKPHMPIAESLDALSRWIESARTDPGLDWSQSKPADVLDKCFDGAGDVLAAGDSVWDGAWNGLPRGTCMDIYPNNKTSRQIAGGAIAGDLFKCQLRPVEAAVAGGTYGEIDMLPHTSRLQLIFPQGVCDYSQLGLGEPSRSWRERMLASVQKMTAAERKIMTVDTPKAISKALEVTELAELQN